MAVKLYLGEAKTLELMRKFLRTEYSRNIFEWHEAKFGRKIYSDDPDGLFVNPYFKFRSNADAIMFKLKWL